MLEYIKVEDFGRYKQVEFREDRFWYATELLNRQEVLKLARMLRKVAEELEVE